MQRARFRMDRSLEVAFFLSLIHIYMRVLLSAKDGQGVTRRVLEEATLGERSGHGEGLLDALDLANGTDRSGKPQEQDLRLRMRGLDLA